MNYYNEFHPPAAAMLRQLIADKLIPDGHVDERSIAEVTAAELAGYTQCHFFAGIGGWPLALELAGWPSTRPVWTGSCPCQSFSSAGKQGGKDDPRHLWPVWFRLVRECRPASVFGEQVASAIAHEWLDEVATDMESEGYAIGSAVLPACSVGAPHRRDRLFFVADAQSCTGWPRPGNEVARGGRNEFGNGSRHGDLANTTGIAVSHGNGEPSGINGFFTPDRRDRWTPENQERPGDGALANASGARSPFGLSAPTPERQGQPVITDDRSGRQLGPWEECEWIIGHDEKARPVKPGIRLLADGFPARVACLHGFGNAIVPSVAAEFIIASQ